MSQLNRAEKRDEYVRRMLLTIGLLALVVLLFVTLWLAADVFLLVFVGLLLAIFLRSLSKPLTKYLRLPDMVSVVTVLLLLTVFLGLLSWFYAPRLAEQAGLFIEGVPELLSQIEEAVVQTPIGRALLEQLPTPNGEAVPGDVLPPQEMLPQIVSTFSTTAGALLGFSAYGLFILFVGLFLAVQPGLYREGLIKLVPQNSRRRAREVMTATVDTLRFWLLGRFISMAAVGVMVTLGLWALGMPLALLLGFLAFLLDFIPNIGPFVAAAPAVLLAFIESPTQALWVALLYFVVQQIESYMITPIVQQKAVHLPPALTIIAVLVIGLMFGILGVIVATPLMAVVLVLAKMLYVEDVLEDSVNVPVEKSKPPPKSKPAAG